MPSPALPMSLPALQFEGVSKKFKRTPVLRDIGFEVSSGELFGMVGINGAGKTTLIKGLLDFCDISSGSIRISGIPHLLTAARKPIAFLPESFVPPHYLTGRDFLRYMLQLYGMRYRGHEAEGALAALDLDLSALSLPVRAFSKGMAQKLGLAACLLSRKETYVLDEPTTGLDPKARALLKGELRRLQAEGRTVFFTSHSLADVQEMCDRMALLHRGELLFLGPPAALCRQHGTDNLEQAFLRCIA